MTHTDATKMMQRGQGTTEDLFAAIAPLDAPMSEGGGDVCQPPPPTTTTGKRHREEDNDSGDDDDDHDNDHDNDNDNNGDDEQEEVPAWVRYMPRGTLSSSSSGHAPSGEGTDADMHTTVAVKPSSNAFGPTSSRAKGQKRLKTGREPPPSSLDPATASQQRIKDKLRRCNVTEAAVLFSMSASVDK
jgi:hypothetical protein